jgi:predicted dehydrogenase
MNQHISRRKFLQNSSIAAATFWIGSNAFGKGKSPNELLNIGIIGTANRAGSNIAGVKHQNIVAICDIDDIFLEAAGQKFPQAKKHNDFRKLLEQKDIDGVVISTADHTHAIASIMAMQAGKHVYCEKPISHNVREARMVAKAAKKYKRITQLGTQIHATNNYRRVVELIQTGAVGKVTEVHVWCSKSKPGELPTGNPPVPPHVHWDLWLGPAPHHEYNPAYHPKNWRVFWAFGGGCLGDMGCHYMDLPFWALNLKAPVTIEAEGPAVHSVVTPAWLIVHYEYAKRGDQPPVKVHWYDGGKRPALASEIKRSRTTDEEKDMKGPANGVLFVGDKGMLWADYSEYKLLPEDKFQGFKAPAPFIPDSVGHHEEWIQACKTGSPTTCNFEYGGALSEAILLGNVAYRTGKKLEWDAEKMKVKNTKDAKQYLEREYRKGWEI